MKNIYTIILMLTICFCANAQKSKDVLYLKNGSVIKGTVVNKENGAVKIKAKDGSVFVYPSDQIQQFTNTKQVRKDSIASRSARAEKRLLVGLTACPTVSITDFKKRTYSEAPLAFSQYSPKAGFTGGFALSYSKGKVGFQTGLLYATNALGYTFIDAAIAAYNHVITYTPANGQPEKQYSRYHSLRLPLLFTVVSKGTKARFFCSLGASVDLTVFLVSTDNLYGKATYSVFKKDNSAFSATTLNWLSYPDEYCGLQMSLGAEISLPSKAVVRICPTFFYSIPGFVNTGLDVQVLFNVKRK